MASKYLSKYSVPEGFVDILHELTREVLRAQPDDILEFAANFFEHKAQGKEYYYESRANVQRQADAESKLYGPTPAYDYAKQAMRVVEVSNANANEDIQEKSAPKSRPITQQSIKSDKPADVSQNSKTSDLSHLEEKKVSKEFISNLYDSAMHQASQSGSQPDLEEAGNENVQHSGQNGETDRNEEQEEEESGYQVQPMEEEKVILEGPIEDYENLALKMQSVYRGKKVRDELKK